MSTPGCHLVVSALLIAVLGACPGPPDVEDAGAAADAGTGSADAGGTCFSLQDRLVTLLAVDDIGGAPIYPDLALGPDERPWVVFTKGTASSRHAAVSSFDGTAWSAPDPVEQQDGVYLGKRPSLVVDAAGTLHVAAYDEDGCRLRYSTRPAGGAWSTTALYLDSVDAGDHSSLFLDVTGALHLTFTAYGVYRIVYGHRSGSDWQFEVVGPGQGARAASSSLVVDAAGQPHVAFYTGDPDQRLRHAVRTGAGWTVEDADATADSGHYPSIALDASGAPTIAALRWPADSSEVRLATRTAAGWQAEVVDSGLGITYTTGLAVLPCGATLVAYARNQGAGAQGLWLAHRNPGEATWTRTSLDASSYVSGIDLVVTAGGRVDIVYLDETSFILKHARL